VSEPQYIFIFVNLTPDNLGNRRRSIDMRGSRVYIDTTRTDAILEKLFIGIDDKGTVPASLTRTIDVHPNEFSKINIEWLPENDNKTTGLARNEALS